MDQPNQILEVATHSENLDFGPNLKKGRSKVATQKANHPLGEGGSMVPTFRANVRNVEVENGMGWFGDPSNSTHGG